MPPKAVIAIGLMDQITTCFGQIQSVTKAMTFTDKWNVGINGSYEFEPALTTESASAVMSSMWNGNVQPTLSYVQSLHTQQNLQVSQNLVEKSTGTSESLTSSSTTISNKQLNYSFEADNHSPTTVDTTRFNLFDYILNDGSMQTSAPCRPCNTSTVQQTHGSFTNNSSTFPSLSIKDTSYSTQLNTSSFQSSSMSYTSTEAEQSLVADQQSTITRLPQCFTPTSKSFGPNEFNLKIALSPLDVSTKLVDWVYVDKTSQEMVLNQNTSLLFEHLFNTYSTLNATIKIILPETGREYEISLKDMEMTDLYSGEKIALFRKMWVPGVFQPLETGLGGFPLLWSPQENDIELVVLDKKREEYRTIRNTFLRTMPESCVIGIERIQNKKLFIRYAFQKALLLDKNSGNEQSVNEKLLFHGTSQTPPSKIWQSEDGFDLRYCRRGMWGIGSYFAEKASYSDQYAYKYTTNLIQCSEMLVANVLTGNSKEMLSNDLSRQLTRPPVYIHATASNPEVLYDTVTGFTKGSRIYVLYKLDMAYPSYLVRYFKLDK